jgi:hypothetical protein
VNGTQLATSAITSDDPATGIFVVTTAPTDGSVVEASYYTQWFLDSELQMFLETAALWVQSSTDFTLIPSGLIPCTLKYSSAEAYLKLAIRWKDYASSTYKLHDDPNEEADAKTTSFMDMSKTFREEALKSRDEFYKRQGRSLQPLFGTVKGNVRQMP